MNKVPDPSIGRVGGDYQPTQPDLKENKVGDLKSRDVKSMAASKTEIPQAMENVVDQMVNSPDVKKEKEAELFSHFINLGLSSMTRPFSLLLDEEEEFKVKEGTPEKPGDVFIDPKIKTIVWSENINPKVREKLKKAQDEGQQIKVQIEGKDYSLNVGNSVKAADFEKIAILYHVVLLAQAAGIIKPEEKKEALEREGAATRGGQGTTQAKQPAQAARQREEPVGAGRGTATYATQQTQSEAKAARDRKAKRDAEAKDVAADEARRAAIKQQQTKQDRDKGRI